MSRRPQAKQSQASSAPRQPAGAARRRLSIALGSIVLIAALAPNWKTLGYDFVWDDPFLIGPHLELHGLRDAVRLWNTPFDRLLNDQNLDRAYFRPVTLFSLAADRVVSKESPRGYHAQNLFWYAVGCLFLWLFAWGISGRLLASTAGAILFALHPTHPESVCFISGRTDLLAGAFLLAALWASVRFGPRIRSDWLKLLPASLILLPGIFSKEVALFGAPLLPITLWLRDRRLSLGSIGRATLPVGLAVGLYLAARVAVLGPPHLAAVAPVEGTAAQILTSVSVIARYVPLLLFPVSLSARHEIAPTHTPDLTFWAGLLALALMGAAIVIAARRRSNWLLPPALFAATLLPLCDVRLLSGALVAERFLFIPSASIALTVSLLPGVGMSNRRAKGAGPGTRAAGTTIAEPDAGPLFLLLSAVAAIWLTTLLLPRVAIWRDEGTLFASMLRDSPDSPHVHGIVGGYDYRHRDLEGAAFHYRRAYELFPKSGEMLLNLVAAEDEMGRIDSAFADARVLNARFPEYGAGWYALGNLYVRIDRPDSASLAYERAIRLMPDFAQAENNLGAVLERMGREEEALAHYERAQAILPGYAEAKRNWERLTARRSGRKEAATDRAASHGRGAGTGGARTP